MNFDKSIFGLNSMYKRDIILQEVLFDNNIESFIDRMNTESLDDKLNIFDKYLCYIGSEFNSSKANSSMVKSLFKEFNIDENTEILNIYERHLIKMVFLLDKNRNDALLLVFNRMLSEEDIYIKWLYLNVVWFLLDRFKDFKLSINLRDLELVENQIKSIIMQDTCFPFIFFNTKNGLRFYVNVLADLQEIDTFSIEEIADIIHSYIKNFKVLKDLRVDTGLLNFFLKNKKKVFYIGENAFKEIVIMANKQNQISELVDYVECVIQKGNYRNGAEYITKLNKHRDKMSEIEKSKVEKLYKVCKEHKRDDLIEVITGENSIDFTPIISIFESELQMKSFKSLIELKYWYSSHFDWIIRLNNDSVYDFAFTHINNVGNRMTLTGFEGLNNVYIICLNIAIFTYLMKKSDFIKSLEELKDNNEFDAFIDKFIVHLKMYVYNKENNLGFGEEILAENTISLIEPMLRKFINNTDDSIYIIPDTARDNIDYVSLLSRLYNLFEKYSCMSETLFNYMRDRIVGTMNDKDNSGNIIKKEKIEGMRNRYLHGLMFNTGAFDFASVFVFVILMLLDIKESYAKICK